ncbi:unnamed protein product, partial [Ectocarpus sp. 8 AP-2014]
PASPKNKRYQSLPGHILANPSFPVRPRAPRLQVRACACSLARGGAGASCMREFVRFWRRHPFRENRRRQQRWPRLSPRNPLLVLSDCSRQIILSTHSGMTMLSHNTRARV